MPRGLGKIKQIAAEAAARQKAYDESGPGIRFLTIPDQQTVKVRFLEQGEDVWYVWTHQLPKQPGQSFGDSVMCLDQDDQGAACPGCMRQKSRTARVAINVIWYGAPKFKRDKDKKIVKDSNDSPIIEGTEDTIAVWNASQTVGGRLEHLDTKHGGLTQHLFSITRQGTNKQTSYMIDLEEANVAPSANDQELYKSKGDPRKVIRTLSAGDMERSYSGGGTAADTPQAGLGQPQPDASMEDNAFAQAATGGAIKRGAFG